MDKDQLHPKPNLGGRDGLERRRLVWHDEGTVSGTAPDKGSSNAFGSAAAAASTAIAQPIHMVVKKKKKKRTDKEMIDENGMDVKLPAKDNGNNKRNKSNE